MNVIDKIRLLSRLNDISNQLQKLWKENGMKVSWGLFWQVLVILPNAIDKFTPFMSPKQAQWAAAIAGLATVLLHWNQAYFNPNGTPAAMPYQPDKP